MRADSVITTTVCLIILAALQVNAGVLLRTEKSPSGRNLLADPGFERAEPGWNAFERGSTRDTSVRRSGHSSGRRSWGCSKISAGGSVGPSPLWFVRRSHARIRSCLYCVLCTPYFPVVPFGSPVCYNCATGRSVI